MKEEKSEWGNEKKKKKEDENNVQN